MSTSAKLNFPCGVCRNTADAAYYGHLTCLEWAVEHNVPWDPDTTCFAVGYGCPNCLRFAIEHGCPWHRDTTWVAAGNGRTTCLQFAVEHGCPWHLITSKCAACGGHLDTLQYIYEYGGHIDSWEESGLQDFEDTNWSEDIKAYLRTVQEDWKNGRNTYSCVKPAKT